MNLNVLHRRPLVAALATTLCLLTACAEVETEKLPAITAEGDHSVLVGETVKITPKTENGSDAAYTYSSSDESVATVSEDGTVTGVAAGDVDIKIVGNDSKAETLFPVVVIDPGAASELPQFAAWSQSAHSDRDSEAFKHWNAEGAVPVTCARCHSSEGFLDYAGADGTPKTVNAPAPTQSVVRCETCHAAAAQALSEVTFPSGVTVTGLDAEARCMTCHQGRASTDSVNKNITASGVTSPDQVSDKLGFQNVHYYPAAATIYGGQVRGGYQYAGQVYDQRFRHVSSFDQCQECHDPHTLKVRYQEACATCHAGTTDLASAKKIRQIASRNQDYDGDGNLTEGIGEEIDGLQELLSKAIIQYAREKNAPICFGDTYPYHFADTNNDGTCSTEEQAATNGYKAWTARLERATYNRQMAKVDPGKFAHNGKYIIQLLHDSIQDVNAALTTKLDVSKLVRNDQGHFNGASAAARNWDSGETVQASCSRCHSGSEGFRTFVQFGTGVAVKQANGLDCATCHNSVGPQFTVFTPTATWQPDGTTRVLSKPEDNLCANCHIGRQSKATIDKAFAANPSGTLGLQNVHYAPAAGTLNGTVTKIGYEYTGKTYAGHTTTHDNLGPGNACVSCHQAVESNHTFKIEDVWEAKCQSCHAVSGPDVFRLASRSADYDGDGNTTEPTHSELEGMGARLWTALRAYGAANAALGNVCYDEHTHPYFFKDTNGDGTCQPTEATSANGYRFNFQMHKAAHNYQFFVKEHGAWAHNFNYMGQLLFDSVEDLTAATPTNMVRP